MGVADQVDRCFGRYRRKECLAMLPPALPAQTADLPLLRLWKLFVPQGCEVYVTLPLIRNLNSRLVPKHVTPPLHAVFQPVSDCLINTIPRVLNDLQLSFHAHPRDLCRVTGILYSLPSFKSCAVFSGLTPATFTHQVQIIATVQTGGAAAKFARSCALFETTQKPSTCFRNHSGAVVPDALTILRTSSLLIRPLIHAATACSRPPLPV